MADALIEYLANEFRHRTATHIAIAQDHRHDALVETLALAVPLRIWELRGRTPEQRMTIAKRCGQHVAEHGDSLMFGGKKGRAAAAFNALAEGLAVAAYQPGGVSFAGRHWCTDHQACERATAGLSDEPAQPDSEPTESRQIETVRVAPQWAASLAGGPDGCAA
jgi:hypothetical protein